MQEAGHKQIVVSASWLHKIYLLNEHSLNR